MKIEKLKLYTGFDEMTCIGKLNEHSNNFWLALYDLSKPEEGKDSLIDKLELLIDTETILSTLQKIEDIYSNRKFSELKMKIYDNDEAFWDSIGNPTGKESSYKIMPTPREIDKFIALLKTSDEPVILSILKIIRQISIIHYNEELIGQLNSLMTAKNYQLVQEAIKVVNDDAEKIDLFFPSLKFNLAQNRKDYHFNTIRAFWSENAKIYRDLIPLLQTLTKSSNSQVKDMSQDVLTRYGALSKEEIKSMDEKIHQREILSIQNRVAKIATTKTLYKFANMFNWDDDIEYMKEVLKHKKCEKAIALLIYWRSVPTYYQKYKTVKEVEDYRKEIFTMQLFIEEKMQKDFFNVGKLVYNPKDDYGQDRTLCNYTKQQIKRSIPINMYA